MAPTKTADAPRGTIVASVQSGLLTFTVRAVPMPEEVTSFLTSNMSTLKRLQRDRRNVAKEDDGTDELRGDVQVDEARLVKPEEFWSELAAILSKCGKDWDGLEDQIWAFGPRRVGPNLLVDRTGQRS
jgi:ribosome assembly protein 1